MEIKIAELKQRHVEAFVKEMPTGKEAVDIPIVLYMGMVVRAACKAGWFIEPQFKIEEVDEMNPAEVRELGNSAMKIYSEAMGIPSPS
jgi:hypothetical protein